MELNGGRRYRFHPLAILQSNRFLATRQVSMLCVYFIQSARHHHVPFPHAHCGVRGWLWGSLSTRLAACGPAGCVCLLHVARRPFLVLVTRGIGKELVLLRMVICFSTLAPNPDNAICRQGFDWNLCTHAGRTKEPRMQTHTHTSNSCISLAEKKNNPTKES